MKNIYTLFFILVFLFVGNTNAQVISTEDFESNPEDILNKIYDFLEIPAINVKNLEKHKVASYPKMKNETRKFLVDLYKSHNKELFDMIKQKFDWDK